MSEQPKRTRGPATRKHYRNPTTGQAHRDRVAFGQAWGAFNSQTAARLRKGTSQ